ncbi:retrovirus-related pol polyprotein LINE-1 [Tanacetum coccineum]
MEKYKERQKDLHIAFLDLEKAYDSVPRELIWKTLVDKGRSRRYIRVVRDMYVGAKTCIRASIGYIEFFPVDVGLYQGSAISPYLFALILDELSRGIQEDIPWFLIFADDIVLVSESVEGLNIRLKNWREVLEDNGQRLKGKFYRVAIRLAMLYGSECWPITKALANRVEVAKLRMLRWTCGKILLDMIPNEVYRAQLKVDSIINKMREVRLRWFGHVRRRPQSAPVRRVESLVVDGLRRRGRPKLRWEDRVKHDMKELLLSEDMTSDRNKWRARIRVSACLFGLVLYGLGYAMFLFAFSVSLPCGLCLFSRWSPCHACCLWGLVSFRVLALPDAFFWYGPRPF